MKITVWIVIQIITAFSFYLAYRSTERLKTKEDGKEAPWSIGDGISFVVKCLVITFFWALLQFWVAPKLMPNL